MTRFLPSRASMLALAGALCLALGACQSSSETAGPNGSAETRSGRTMDTAEMNVTLPGTTQLLQKGLTNIALSRAVANINGWQRRLEEANADAYSGIINNLDALESELGSESIDGSYVGQVLEELGETTMEAASRARKPAADNVLVLGETLTTAGRSLQ